MTTEDCPGKQDNWFPVLITEFFVISIINALTITAFARIRHLRKRSTYLIINLTVADLLLGAVAGPLYVYHKCKEDHDEKNHHFSWPAFSLLAFQLTFLIASPVNLSLISLERLHAALFPFKHCLIRKWFYFKIIIGSWLIALLLGSLMAGLYLKLQHTAFAYAWASFCVVTLLVLTISYLIILLNVQKSPHSQNVGALQTERKLSITLFIVTGVSVLTILSWAIYKSIPKDIEKKWNEATSIYFRHMLAGIYFANSIVNPLVYAIRMQEFRNALGNIVSRQRQDEQRRQTRAERKRARRSQLQTML